jgi:hypothetical protein
MIFNQTERPDFMHLSDGERDVIVECHTSLPIAIITCTVINIVELKENGFG